MTAQADTYPLLSAPDLAHLPQPTWLIDGLVPAQSFSVLYGASGLGKSFLALDWGLCVATELAWYGRATKKGAVLYVAAEGTGGLHRRVNAWQQARSCDDVTGIHFLPQPVNLLDPDDVGRLQRTIQGLQEPPSTIIYDTMARSMVGGDENSSRDVGRFIDNVDKLRKPIDASALVVHHTGKSGEDERGSSALRGAADMMAALRENGSSLRLECDKAKDAEEFDPWTLHLSETAESCVLRLGSNHTRLSNAEQRILETLPEAFGSEPAASTKLQGATGLAERSYYRALTALETNGYLQAEKQNRSKLYSLTEQGRTALLPTTANNCQADNLITAANATPLGVAGGSQAGSHNGSNDGVAAGGLWS